MKTKRVTKNSISYRSLQIFIRVVQIILQIRVFATENNAFLIYQILGTSIPWMLILSLLLYFPNKIFIQSIITQEDYFEIFQLDFFHWYPSSNRTTPKSFYFLKTFLIFVVTICQRINRNGYKMFSNASILLSLVDLIDLTLLTHNHLFHIHDKLNIKFDLMQIINECILSNLFLIGVLLPAENYYTPCIYMGLTFPVGILEQRRWFKEGPTLVNHYLWSYVKPLPFFIYFERLTPRQKQIKNSLEYNNILHLIVLIFIVSQYISLWYKRQDNAPLNIGYEIITAQFIIGAKFMVDILKWLINYIRKGSVYHEFTLTKQFISNYNPLHPDFQIFRNRPGLMRSEVKIISPLQNETALYNLRNILYTILDLDRLIQIKVNSTTDGKQTNQFFDFLDINPYGMKIFMEVSKDEQFGLIALESINQSKYYGYNIKVKVKDDLIEIISTALAINYELLPNLKLVKYQGDITVVYNRDFILMKSILCSLSLFFSQMRELMIVDSRLICLDLYYD